MNRPISTADLEAYLGEALSPAAAAEIEKALRDDKALQGRLASVHARHNAGVVSVGEIWRRQRLSCATRDQLGSYLLGTLTDDQAAYIAFHIEVVGCRYCEANLDDLRQQQAEAQAATETRRRKYFQSSVGRLRREK